MARGSCAFRFRAIGFEASYTGAAPTSCISIPGTCVTFLMKKKPLALGGIIDCENALC